MWIEILPGCPPLIPQSVTSFAEVWIEIFSLGIPSPLALVTSFAEVWIEIVTETYAALKVFRHFLRGSVD